MVGVDGSDSSLNAVDWATDEAARHSLPLRLVYASRWERYEGLVPSGSLQRPSFQVLADNVVATAVERVQSRNPAVKVIGEVLPEDPVDALLDESDHALALVTGCRGRGELKGLLLGSVSLTVAGRAHGPVIVIRGDAGRPERPHGRIVLGAGKPGTSGAAVRFAFREAEARHCALDVVRAWRHPGHESVERLLPAGNPALYDEERASTLIDTLLQDTAPDHPDVRVNRSTIEGLACAVLVNRSAAADLVIIGLRRARGHGGLQLGPVAHMLLHHAQCPVAVVPELQ